MKTAIKLNRKELLALYEKSADVVKASLLDEFGADFFVESPKTEILPVKKNTTPVTKNKRKQLIDFAMLFEYTSILRIVGYACLVGLVLAKI